MYARSIHVEWTHLEHAQCVTYASWGDSNLFLNVWRTDRPSNFEEMARDNCQNLAPFARQIFEQAVSEGLTCTHALAKIVMNRDMGWRNALLATEDYLVQAGPRTLGRYTAMKTLNQFLAGQTLNSDRQVAEDAVTAVNRFCSRLSGLGRTRRFATKQRDYVLAVWVDCPKYILPRNFKALSLPLLLEDAILQLEKNFGMSIPVSAVAGLFGSREASALWRPSRYLDQVKVSHVRQVYGAVVL
jgi:hypothetical protein